MSAKREPRLEGADITYNYSLTLKLNTHVRNATTCPLMYARLFRIICEMLINPCVLGNCLELDSRGQLHAHYLISIDEICRFSHITKAIKACYPEYKNYRVHFEAVHGRVHLQYWKKWYLTKQNQDDVLEMYELVKKDHTIVNKWRQDNIELCEPDFID